MNRIRKGCWACMLVVSVVVLSGCISPRAFVDPQYRKASYEAIQHLPEPVPAKVDVQFQRNGKALPSVDSELRGHVERTLRASGVFAPTTDANASVTVGVIANNIADIGAARAKGFSTGLTFGAAGTMVDDYYEFDFSFHDAMNHDRRAVYQHAIHTAIGNTQVPPGQIPTTLANAFGRVVEDVTLNFVKELQDAGLPAR